MSVTTKGSVLRPEPGRPAEEYFTSLESGENHAKATQEMLYDRNGLPLPANTQAERFAMAFEVDEAIESGELVLDPGYVLREARQQKINTYTRRVFVGAVAALLATGMYIKTDSSRPERQLLDVEQAELIYQS